MTEDFIRSYATSGATTGAFHWFGAFEQDAADNKILNTPQVQADLLSFFLGK